LQVATSRLVVGLFLQNIVSFTLHSSKQFQISNNRPPSKRYGILYLLGAGRHQEF